MSDKDPLRDGHAKRKHDVLRVLRNDARMLEEFAASKGDVVHAECAFPTTESASGSPLLARRLGQIRNDFLRGTCDLITVFEYKGRPYFESFSSLFTYSRRIESTSPHSSKNTTSPHHSYNMPSTVNRVVTKLMRSRTRDAETPCPNCSAHGKEEGGSKLKPAAEKAEMLDDDDMAW
ncbi:hypothetical protein M422DRAFT_253155 [Sphaerobolus stellatus SS14]|uniref:Uncharacterized protein n=1 Tax=Sphaerobolus stellatus (strain SS14) TaxID=990650 RepID=A0A0C9VNI3_SPHS4|nr:hypothetical protein M422DRAFT_253155 [Sphaerobolus stellatus SS14]